MTGRPLKNGLHVKRILTCPCGTQFETKNPSAAYCSNVCRRKAGGWGWGAQRVVPSDIEIDSDHFLTRY